MNYLERQYLLAAHELAMQDPRRTFHEDEIINSLALDTSLPDYADPFTAISADFMRRGYVEPDSKGGGMGRRTLRLTRAGIGRAERLADPIKERKALRSFFLRAVYELANGSPTEFVYWRDLAFRFDSADREEMPPRSIMAAADQLAGSGFITIEVEDGTIYRITAKGVDEVEGNRQEPQPSVSNIFNIENAPGSVIGTHNTAELTNNFDFRAIEQRIELEGGEDKEELRRALAQVERLLERGDYLDRGALAKFSGAMERHSWFTGSVMQALLGFATQAIG